MWDQCTIPPAAYKSSCCYTSLPTLGYKRLRFCPSEVWNGIFGLLICISCLLVRLSIFPWVYCPFEFLNIWTLEIRAPLLGTANFYFLLFFLPIGVFAFFWWFQEVLYIFWLLSASYICCKFHLQVCGGSSFFALINRSWYITLKWKRESSYIVGEIATWCGHYGK